MRLFFKIIVFSFTCSLNSVESQLNMSFQHRFGPNSPLYNEPFYFKKKPKKKTSLKRKSYYREQIRKTLSKTSRKRSSLEQLHEKS